MRNCLTAKLLTKDDARCIAVNVAKLPSSFRPQVTRRAPATVPAGLMSAYLPLAF